MSRPYQHRKAQREAVEDGAHRCRVCANVTDDAEGHHLIEYRIGGAGDKHIMIPLCRRHHQEYHSGKLDVRFYRL